MRSKSGLNRRQFIGAVGAGAAVAGCATNTPLPEALLPAVEEPIADSVASEESGDLSTPLYPALTTTTILLNRITFGPTAADFTEIGVLGYSAYLEKQLAYTNIDDSQMAAWLAPFPVLNVTPSLVGSFSDNDAIFGLSSASLLRAIYSRRQLYERMVEFWSDHFNISTISGRSAQAQLKVIDDREVIRRYALGRFRDLLGASAQSPAMLRYLDNESNRAGHPNENYARELMELHTLGINGGYTQHDVQELARALTGWSIGTSGPLANYFQFKPEYHDYGTKQIMGLNLPAGWGMTDGTRALDYLASHPSTAQFIAGKLVAFFVSEDRPNALVNQAAATFQQTNGDIKATLRTILSESAIQYATAKVKRPSYLLAQVARQSGVQVASSQSLWYWASQMGHLPFIWPTPDGYPQSSSYWAPGLLPRWNSMTVFASGDNACLPLSAKALAQSYGASTPVQVVNVWNRLFFGYRMIPSDRGALLAFINVNPQDEHRKYVESLALALSLPAFQLF
jgi:uncharacterized protein (DUF1800 family)